MLPDTYQSYMHPYMSCCGCCGPRATLSLKKGEGNTLRVGISFCAPGDSFVKAKGRHIASSRAEKKGRYSFAVDLDNWDAEYPMKAFVIEEFVRYCMDKNSKVPRFARRGAIEMADEMFWSNEEEW